MANNNKKKKTSNKKFLIICIVLLILTVPFFLKKKVYYCNSDEVLLEDGKTCASFIVISATPKYYCNNITDTLIGTACKTATTLYAPANGYSCPYGYTYAGYGCITNITYPAQVKYTCSIGELDGTNCVIMNLSSAKVKKVSIFS